VTRHDRRAVLALTGVTRVHVLTRELDRLLLERVDGARDDVLVLPAHDARADDLAARQAVGGQGIVLDAAQCCSE